MGRFAIIGLDNFGYNLALALSKRQHEVLVIDSSESRVQNIRDTVKKAVAVDISNGKKLDKFVDSTVDAAIVSMGENIPSSVLTVLHLKELGVDNIVAKAVSGSHEKILRLVGATDTILPEKNAAEGIAMKLTTKNLVENIPLAEDHSIVEVAIPDALVGKTLGELDIRNKYSLEVIAIKNVLLGEFYLIPKADFKIAADCALIVIGKNADTEKITL
jgi:trk system potassium uptake protein